MRYKQKGTTKPTQETKKAKVRSNIKEEKQKTSFVLLFVLVLLIFTAIAVPVSYLPFLNNIAKSFGLPTEMTRQLTLIDLALNSFGIETDNMKEAFKKTDITAGPADPVFYSRFEPEMSHLINARETYFYEFERTRRRPDEISGIYKDGKEVSTPNLKQGQVAGVRSLPKEDKIQDDSYPGASFGTTSPSNISQGAASGTKGNYVGDLGGLVSANAGKDDSKESVSSSKSKNSLNSGRGTGSGTSADLSSSNGQGYAVSEGSQNGRQSRSSFDRSRDADGNPIAMPGFVSSVYANNQQGRDQNNGENQPLDLSNSNMIKPVVKGESFRVSRQDTPVEQFLGSSEFANTLNGLRSFGGYGSLGFYVADDIPENTGRGTFKKFGVSGEDAINSYFYSYAASGRKYSESSKYLAELAFSGEKASNEEILIARGQKNQKPHMLPEGDSPLQVMTKVKEAMRTCNEAERHYWEVTRAARQEYVDKRNYLKNIANNSAVPYAGDVPAGAPGSCDGTVAVVWHIGSQTVTLLPITTPLPEIRNEWNSTIDRLEYLCNQLQNEERTYVNACHMNYEVNPELDNCNTLKALKVGGGVNDISFWSALPSWWGEVVSNNPNAWRNLDCATTVNWMNQNVSPTFNGTNDCHDSTSCQNAIDELIGNIEDNVNVSPGENFLGI